MSLRRKSIYLGVVLAATVTLTACDSQNELAGTVIGATVGGVVGDQFGDGSGNKVATAVGAMVGAYVGQRLGAQLDETSRLRANAAAQRALSTGEEIYWENPNNAGGAASGSFIPKRSGVTASGRECREYTTTIIVGGREEQGYGTACLSPSGDWEVV